MIVGYIHPVAGLHTGNLRWLGKHPAVRGRFPRTHPVAPGSLVFGNAPGGQCGDAPELGAFRLLGYWASCFPEGDGITFRPLDDTCTAERGMEDVLSCWPTWELVPEDKFRRIFDLWEREQAERERMRRRAFIEAKERAATGRCSSIIRFGVFCTREIGHDGKHDPTPITPPKKQCCPTCGNWILPGREHRCGEGVCL